MHVAAVVAGRKETLEGYRHLIPVQCPHLLVHSCQGKKWVIFFFFLCLYVIFAGWVGGSERGLLDLGF